MHLLTSGLGICPSVAVTQLRMVMSALNVFTYPWKSASERLGGFLSNLSPLEEPRRIPQSATVRLGTKSDFSAAQELTCVGYS